MITRDTSAEKILMLTEPCSCNACQHGCTMGSGVLGAGDAEEIAAFLGITVAELTEQHLEEIEKFNTKHLRPKIEREGKQYGKCTFFQEGKCRVHAVKPFECKVAMPCKPYGDQLIAWFDVTHFLNPNDPESVRQYAAHLAVGGLLLPGATIEEVVPDAEQRRKILSYEVLK